MLMLTVMMFTNKNIKKKRVFYYTHSYNILFVRIIYFLFDFFINVFFLILSFNIIFIFY